MLAWRHSAALCANARPGIAARHHPTPPPKATIPESQTNQEGFEKYVTSLNCIGNTGGAANADGGAQ